MEHRYTHRHAETFEVGLSNPRYGEARARVLDVSPEGMALQVADNPYPEGVVVTLQLPDSQRHRYRAGWLKGYVTYVLDERLGIWLLAEDDEDQTGA